MKKSRLWTFCAIDTLERKDESALQHTCRICPQVGFLSPLMPVENSKVREYTGKHFCVHLFM